MTEAKPAPSTFVPRPWLPSVAGLDHSIAR